jgi:glycosyltransferase involved in cell wall biosynthesis
MQSKIPQLSICVPSRNRQRYFQETIKALTASCRDDVEFVFVDNSDDPAAMDTFIEPYLADIRVKYIPSGEKVRPMVDNWEVAARASTGRWITFIGDDDYMDPDAAGLFRKIEAVEPNVEAIDWHKLNYFWPDENRPPVGQPIQLAADVHRVPKSLLMARTFKWESARRVLLSGFSIYHSAVSRKLFDRIRRTYSDRFFEHPIVDYDSLMKNVMLGENFVHVTRPLSVLGVCPLSNTAALGDRDKSDKIQKQFHQEHAMPMDDWPCYRDYPFKSRHGVTACIGMTHHWFSKTYGYNFKDFEANFATACAIQCGESANLEQFEIYSEGYREVFRTWKGGKYLKYFKPEFKSQASTEPFRGFSGDKLFVFERTPWTQTAGDFYHFIGNLLMPVEEIVVDLNKRVVDVTHGAGRDLQRVGGRR